MDDVGLDYPGRPGVLRGIRLRMPVRSLLVVRGRSGSGKSSLLALAAGLQAPTRGRVEVMGEAYSEDPAQRAALRGRHIGLVFQHLHLLGELTILENAELPLRLARVPRREARPRATSLLETFGIAGLADRRPAQVSGGEQQRAAIARALALRPGLLVADEPTSSLDAANAQSVVQALQQAAKAGAAVLVASHDELMRRAGGVQATVVDGRLEAA